MASLADLTLRSCQLDLALHSGKRAAAEQLALLEKGVTQVEHSKHMGDSEEDDADAIDLVPVVNGKLSWDDYYCLVMARAAQRAAQYLDIPVRWGGVWDRDLRDMSDNLAVEVTNYRARRNAKGLSAFFDGVHLERRTSA